jgi:hypothetical protein
VDRRLRDGLHPLVTPERPRNPFRNEADAFRVLVQVVAAGAIVAAVAELIGGLPAVIAGLLLIGVGLWRSWGLWQSWKETGSVPREPEEPEET